MSAASEVNLKQTLRKLEFPLCAKEALHKIALDLMSEFIFCEVDRRGNKRSSPLSSLLELQLLEILFEHFNSLANEAARNTVFLSLFSGTTALQRAGILSKLVSLAIGIPSPAILTSTSTWMQQLGCTSIHSCKLAQAIVHDYFHLVPSAAERMKILPDVAPQFTANFLTAVAENYFNSKKKRSNISIGNLVTNNNFLGMSSPLLFHVRNVLFVSDFRKYILMHSCTTKTSSFTTWGYSNGSHYSHCWTYKVVYFSTCL
jgi:hypothetical protein